MRTALLTPEEEPDHAKVLKARKESGHWVVHHCDLDAAREAVDLRVWNDIWTRASLGLPPVTAGGLS
jgi:hypothetical protein